jgi:penicillin-binding protein 2
MTDPFSPYIPKKKNAATQPLIQKRFKKGKPSLDWEEGAYGEGENSDDYYEGHSGTGSFWLLAAFVLVVFLVLGGKIVYLQAAKGGYYTKLADGNHIRSQPIFATRGIISDSQGTALVQNVPNFELDVTTADLPTDYASEVQSVAAMVKGDANNLMTAVQAAPKNSYQGVSVIPDLDKDSAVALQSQIANFPGFTVANVPVRQYTDSIPFSQVLGYTGKITQNEITANPDIDYLLNDSIGKSGIEDSYEKYLRGTNGAHEIEVDAQGHVQSDLGDTPPIPGDNIQLNIDKGLQDYLYNDLLTKNPNKNSAAVAVDPRTGKVLALVSVPGFDANEFATGISQANYSALISNPENPLFNQAIAGQYPSGSTIKPVMAAAGLQEGVITPETKVDDTGDLVVGAFHFHGWVASGLGIMDVRSAIAMSSDIFFYTVGGGQQSLGISGLGPEKIAQYEGDFGLGQKTGIDMPGEASGLIASPEERLERFPNDPAESAWYLGDTYHESIGQGDQLVTPLQDAMWTATVANGGTLYKPYVVNKVTDTNGKVVLQNNPTVVRKVPVSAANMQIVQEGMRQTVTAGTAKLLQKLSITSAAKTGTAQYSATDANATDGWMSAYAPYEDPQIAIVILVAGSSGEAGTNSAAVVTRDALGWWAANRYQK